MLACNCLNVIIELELNNKITKELLELSDEEKCDSFFAQEIWHAGKLLNINKTHSGLVHTRNSGSWIISRCLNCDVQTHAIHREKGASFVLVNSKLLNSEAINKIKSSDLISSIFHIVVNPNDIGSQKQAFDTYRNKEVETFIKNINDILTNYIRKEQVAVEERIKKYSDEQYELLNTLKDKVFKEREALVSVIQSAGEGSTNQNWSPKSPKGFGDVLPEKFSAPNSPSAAPYSPKRPKSTVDIKLSESELKEDLIFDFETDDFVNEDESFQHETMDDSESEDFEEDAIPEEGGISINQRQIKPGCSIAKSCPVDIPIFSVPSRIKNSRSEVSDEADDSSPTEQVDIAASIKALAKSVHGDAIFGELPRPRFSTQI